MAELTEAAAVRRLGDRLGFSLGGDPLAAAQDRGFSATLEACLKPSGSDAGATGTPPPDLPRLSRPGKDGDRQAKKAWRRQLLAQQQTLTLWWLDRMVAADHQITERLTWFWHGHFSTSVQKVKSANLMLVQNETFRRLGRGSFAMLAQDMIIDPALLVWLDGNDNTAAAPNENLSREFMELFTLGHGSYSESDVQAAARTLTGWRVNRRTGQATLRSGLHDDHDKTVLGSTGNFGAVELVDVLLARPACPAFVVSRLWFRLVSPTPPPKEALGRLTAAYGKTGDLAAVLAQLAAEPAFRDSASGLVKQPVEWAVGLMRALGLQPSGLAEQPRRRLLGNLRGMGQLPFRPPSVGGWPAGSAWLTTAAALSRMEAARLLADQADLGSAGRVPARQRAEQVRRLLGVDRFTVRTTNAIEQVADQLPAAIAVGACSPEYTVSG